MQSCVRAIAALACALIAAGCAATSAATGQNDPFEGMNRFFFNSNQTLDKIVAKPAAQAYVAVVPEFGRDGIHNFLTNLQAPVVFANDVFQGEGKRGGYTLGRFIFNSTIGLGGLIDVATKMGIPYHDEDFGQTLAVWGVPDGAYLVLPVIGPSNPRDLSGRVVDTFLDPSLYIEIRDKNNYELARTLLQLLDTRSANLETLDSIERSSVDFYASVRSLYRQQRNSEIANGAVSLDDLPDY